MSFFDEGDEPTQVSSGARRQPRPRRPATASSGRGGPPDRQTLLLRQAAAVGLGLLILILLIFGVRSCANSRKERALKDYNRDATAVISDSDSQVGKPFFQLMNNGAREGDQLRVQVNQLRLAADEDVNRAKGFDVPDAMKPAQDNLLLALNLRADALSKIADQIPRAQGRGQPSEDAIAKIAGQMQQFSASDVIYKVRVAPFIKQGLDDEGISGQTIATSQFLPDIAWLSPQTVADGLGRSAGGGGPSNTTAAPGLHGHGLTSVAVGGVTLAPSPGVNRVPAGSGGPTFTVKFANQGDNDERDVRVTIRVRGAGAPITQTKTIAQTKAKTDATVSIPLGKAPPVGQAVTVEASIAGVPGEMNTDNNKQSYTVIFQR